MISDFHVHTRFCDGKSDPEEYIEKARELGLETIGFSSHAPAAVPSPWRMKKEEEALYRARIRALAEKEQGIEILLGTETDPNTTADLGEYDFLIGSLHDLTFGEEIRSVDESYEVSRDMVTRHFGGDWYAYTAAYFAQLCKMADSFPFTFIGHFDLVTKFNERHPHVDPTSQKFLRPATDAMDALIGHCDLLEINTGAISRGMRDTPYPAVGLLQYWRSLGGEILFCSDAHQAQYLAAFADRAEALARKAGYTRAVTLHKRGGKLVRDFYEF